MTADDLAWMPALNAVLNATCTLLLVAGRVKIARGDVPGHRRMMLRAVWTSLAFLVAYLTYHVTLKYAFGTITKPYPQVGLLRTVYLSILWPHTLLAVSLLGFVPRTLFLALRGRLEEHKRIARWTFPIWVFVSATGVVVYLMRYPFAPAEPGR